MPEVETMKRVSMRSVAQKTGHVMEIRGGGEGDGEMSAVIAALCEKLYRSVYSDANKNG